MPEINNPLLEQLKETILALTYPLLNYPFKPFKQFKQLGVNVSLVFESQDTIEVTVELPFYAKMQHATLRELIASSVKPLAPNHVLNMTFNSKAFAHAIPVNLTRLKQVNNIIAVASGKGGVGKSTTAVNLALALKAQGARVGILDADIYGPNQPHMLGASAIKARGQKGALEPVMSHGIQSMSIGYLVEVDTAMIWRGPMVSSALQQLLNETLWDNLDYLIIDLPPGTGDIQLTLSQKVPVTAAVIVTTPQDVALLDVRKAVNMFDKVNVPVLGIVENMATHTCSACGHVEAIFGDAGGVALAAELNYPVLAKLPLDMQIRIDADAGTPTVVAHPEEAVAKTYLDLALQVGARLSLTKKDYTSKFGAIKVENTLGVQQ